MKRVIYILALVFILCACGDSQAAQPTPTPDLTATAVQYDAATAAAQETADASITPTVQPTETPTPVTQPTVASTQAVVTPQSSVAPSAGPALLGSDIGTFVTANGQPNDHSDLTSGSYHFARYSGSNIDELIVHTDIFDAGLSNLVMDVTVQSTDTGGDTGWTQEQATAICGAFFPRDAVHQRHVYTNDGYDEVYYSPSLAKLFPASAFTDASGNQTKAGLFDVLYLYKASPMIDSCEMILGTQQMNG